MTSKLYLSLSQLFLVLLTSFTVCKALIDCSASHFLLENHHDVASICKCKNCEGSLTIRSEIKGEIQLNGIESIRGFLAVKQNPYISGITSQTLKQIGHGYLESSTSLSTVSFPHLTHAKAIHIWDCSALSKFEIPEISSLWAIDIIRTGIRELRLGARTIMWAYISANPSLSHISLALEIAAFVIEITENAQNITIELPYLERVESLTFRRDALSPEPVSFPSSNFVSRLPTLHLDSLTSVKDLLIISRTPIDDVSLKHLAIISGSIGLHGALGKVDLPELKRVDGSVSATGSIESLIFQELVLMNGNLSVQSTNKSFNCSMLDQLRLEGAIKGSYTCRSTENRSAPSDNDPLKAQHRTHFGIVSAFIATTVVIVIALCYLAIRNHRNPMKKAFFTTTSFSVETQHLLEPEALFSELQATSSPQELCVGFSEFELEENPRGSSRSDAYEMSGKASEQSH